MSQVRIEPLTPPYTAETKQAFDVVMPPGVPPLALFRIVGRNQRGLERMMRGGLLDRGSISLRQREIMILRTCALCHCSYEWGVHVAFFKEKAGLTEDQIADTTSAQPHTELWSDDELAIIALADALHRQADCDDAVWERVRKHFADDQCIELIMLAGSYHMVSYLANACRVPAEAFAAPFPPASEKETPSAPQGEAR